MEPIITAFTEVVKYWTANHFKTEDRFFDAAVLALITAICAYFVAFVKDYDSKKIKEKFREFTYYFKCRRNVKVDDNFHITEFDEVPRDFNNINNFFRVKFVYPHISHKIAFWIKEVYPDISKYSNKNNELTMYALDEANEDYKFQLTDIEDKKVLTWFNFFPISYCNGEYVYAHYENNYLLLLSMNKESIIKTVRFICKSVNVNINAKSTTTSKVCSIMEYDPSKNWIPKTTIKPTKTFDNFVFKDKKLVVNMLTKFKNGKLFDDFPFANNLGILLHGPPGTGKTTFVKATCNFTGRDALIIDFTKIKNRSQLDNLFKKEYIEKYVYVFEEFDFLLDFIGEKEVDYESVKEKRLQAIVDRINAAQDEELKRKLRTEFDKIMTADSTNDKIDLGYLLTTLDGLVEHENRIIIATTNFPSKIPKALLRPGRFDLKIELGLFSKNETVELLCLLFKASDEEKEYVETLNIPEKIWSPVHILQQAIIRKTLYDTAEFLIHNVPQDFTTI